MIYIYIMLTCTMIAAGFVIIAATMIYVLEAPLQEDGIFHRSQVGRYRKLLVLRAIAVFVFLSIGLSLLISGITYGTTMILNT